MRYMLGLRQPKVVVLVLVGGIAFGLSFVLHGTPLHWVHLSAGPHHPLAYQEANTHPIDVMLGILRFGGGLMFVIGVLAFIAYGRGEMDLPIEAVPPESHTMDDGLGAQPHRWHF